MPYKDKDKERERSRNKALRQYHQKKNDPEWYANKLERNQQYAEQNREAARERTKERKKKHRQECLNRLGGKCAVCGTTSNLEFDHIDPKTKKFKITAGLSYRLEVLFEEVDKCMLLCKKHHIEKTKANNEYKNTTTHK
tara:strand:- start:28 stop:444 length:417 start_codon:yes stop_codon:yes gene_type:complete